jgi:hypothetical protein
MSKLFNTYFIEKTPFLIKIPMFMRDHLDIFGAAERKTALGRKLARITIGELEAKQNIEFIGDTHNFVMGQILSL